MCFIRLGQILKKSVSLFESYSVCRKDEMTDPAVKQSHCCSEEYDIGKNKKNCLTEG